MLPTYTHIKRVDTTGAGDAFTAALAVRYMQNGNDISDAARFANCVAAYTVTKSGAFDALPRHKTLPRPSKITVEYLPPVIPDANKSYDEISEQIRSMIAE